MKCLKQNQAHHEHPTNAIITKLAKEEIPTQELGVGSWDALLGSELAFENFIVVGQETKGEEMKDILD